MRYQGSKSRIAKPIANILSITSNEKEDTVFVSLFCGSCAIESKVTGYSHKILNDNNKYLIEMFNGAQKRYVFPGYVSKEQYLYIRDHKDEDPALTGFVGFGCSFGGKFFGGYASSKKNRCYAGESKRSIDKDMPGLMNAKFICEDYRNVDLPEKCVVYCDPPYNGTTGYVGETFDSTDFWNYVRQISYGHLVFVSEHDAPDDFVAIWEKPILRQLDVNHENHFMSTEKLFIYKDNLLIYQSLHKTL